MNPDAQKFCKKRQTIALRVASRHRAVAGVGMLEMMVVMLALAVLAVLLAVKIQSLRGAAGMARCASNLRQIGAANLAYAMDHQGRIAAQNNVKDADGNPTPRHLWYRYIWRTYFGAANGDGTPKGDTGPCEVLICPADPTRGGGPEVSITLRRSYNVNQRLAKTGGSRSLREVSHPAETMYAGDADWVAAGGSEFIIPTSQANLDAIPRKRHHGRANFVFLDGHVESISIEQIYPNQSRHAIFELLH